MPLKVRAVSLHCSPENETKHDPYNRRQSRTTHTEKGEGSAMILNKEMISVHLA